MTLKVALQQLLVLRHYWKYTIVKSWGSVRQGHFTLNKKGNHGLLTCLYLMNQMHCFSVMEGHVQQKTVRVISLLLLTRDYFTDIFHEKDCSQQQSISARLLGCLPNILIQSHVHHMPTLRLSNFCERLTNSVLRHFLLKSKQPRCRLKILSDEQGLKLPQFREIFLHQLSLFVNFSKLYVKK